MRLKIKKVHENAITPLSADEGSAGLDLTSVSKRETDLFFEHDIGIAFELPKNHVGLLFPRSSISNKGLSLANSVGVLDQSFRGTVKFRFYKNEGGSDYEVGDRIGQLLVIPYPAVEIEEVQELSDSERGTGGFGSSGK